MTSVTVDAERMVLGAVLRDNALLPEAEVLLKPEHFSDDRHRTIYRAMLALSEHGRVVDELTLKDELHTTGALVRAGGIVYVSGLDEGLPRISSLDHWVAIVRAKALRRAILALGQRLVESSEDESLSTETVIDGHSQQLNRILDAQEAGNTQHIAQVLKDSYKNLERFLASKNGVTGVTCGFSDIDRLTSGWQPGTLNVIGARPSRGKTTMVMQMGVSAAKAGFKVVVFSLEMPPEAVTLRALLSEANVDKWDMKHRSDHEYDWQMIARAQTQLGDLPMWFDRRESPTVTQIRAVCRKFRATVGMDLLIIDHLQRVPVDPKTESRFISIGDNVQAFKSLARALKVPVLLASQLRRDAEEKRPTLADLGESGRIEQEADIVAFLHPKESPADHPESEFIVAKHREGPLDDLVLSFEKQYARFVQTTDTNWKP